MFQEFKKQNFVCKKAIDYFNEPGLFIERSSLIVGKYVSGMQQTTIDCCIICSRNATNRT
jgi:hypothetical protein